MLSQAGITHTDQLLVSGGTAKGRTEIVERCRINEQQILKWINMSDLFRVKSVAGQYAELLEAAGVDTVKELCHQNPGNLLEKMRELNQEVHLVRAVPGLKSIESWIKQAGKLKSTVHY